MAKNTRAIKWLWGVLVLVLIALLILLSYFLFTPKADLTGKAIFVFKTDLHKIDVRATEGDNSNVFIEIANNEEVTYYIERVEISGCEVFDKIIPVDSNDKRTIEIRCSEVFGKEIKILYKQSGNPMLFEYTNTFTD